MNFTEPGVGEAIWLLVVICTLLGLLLVILAVVGVWSMETVVRQFTRLVRKPDGRSGTGLE